MATQTRSAPASGPPFYIWEVPGKPISIQLSFDVIDRLYPEIMRGLGALKRRGAEVGGILLGRLAPDSPEKVVIEDFEPVASEYLTGPSYNLSANDRVAFEAAIARRRSQAAGGLSVVGFYRSHTRDDLYMDDADMSLAQGYFPDAGNVFLLMKPFASKTSIGGFFFWENRAIHRQSSYLQFPFHRGELGGGESRPAPVPALQETERPLPPYTPAAELRRKRADFTPEEERFSPAARTSLSILSAPPPKAPPRTSVTPMMVWLLFPFLAVAGAAGFFAYREVAAPKPPPINLAEAETTLPLKLSVSEKQNQLDVTWDRNAPAIVHARRGVLSISDGVNKKELELTGAQLRTGRVLYSRLSTDVGLRLEVFSDRPDSVAESIRIVSTESTQKAPATAPPVSERPPGVERPPVASVERPKRIGRPARPKPASEGDPKPALTPASPPPVATPAPEVELQRPARRR